MALKLNINWIMKPSGIALFAVAWNFLRVALPGLWSSSQGL